MKKKVLLEAERLRYGHSGIANICKSLILGLQELNDDEISVFGPKKILQKLSVKNVISWKPVYKFLNFSTKHFDVVHVSHQLSYYFHRINSKTKKIVTLHDLNFLHDASKASKKRKMQRLVQKNIGNADVIVCISNFVKRDFLENKELFKLQENVKIEVIHNGIIFPQDKHYQSENLNYLLEKPFILSIGVLFPKKNQKTLLPLLLENDKSLVLISSDEKQNYKQEFFEEADKLGVSERIHLLKNISEEEKYFLLQNCESLCHPSLAEGFGIPPIEAMYFGKPIFLSDRTSLPEIGGDMAYYFENFSTDEVVKVYKEGLEDFEKNKSQRISELHRRAGNFSYQTMAKSYLEIYNSC